MTQSTPSMPAPSVASFNTTSSTAPLQPNAPKKTPKSFFPSFGRKQKAESDKPQSVPQTLGPVSPAIPAPHNGASKDFGRAFGELSSSYGFNGSPGAMASHTTKM